MYSVSDFRRGLPIIVDDQPYYIVEFQHFKMGRGKANVRTKLKHIKTGSIVEKVFGTSDSFKPPDLENRKMQYLYENGGGDVDRGLCISCFCCQEMCQEGAIRPVPGKFLRLFKKMGIA